MKELLRKLYRPSRFEGREKSDKFWAGYSDTVTKSHEDSLRKNGVTYISQHDSVFGRIVKINSDLSYVVDDTDNAKNKGTLTHIF